MQLPWKNIQLLHRTSLHSDISSPCKKLQHDRSPRLFSHYADRLLPAFLVWALDSMDIYAPVLALFHAAYWRIYSPNRSVGSSMSSLSTCCCCHQVIAANSRSDIHQDGSHRAA